MGDALGNPLYWVLGTLLLAGVAGGLAYGIATRKLGRSGPYLGGVFVFAVLWTVWPYWAIYDLQTAMVKGDKVRLSSMVDWDSVREGMREDLKAAYAAKIRSADPRIQALGQAVGGAVIDQVVQRQINPAMLSENAKAGMSDRNPMSQVRYAFFAGSPMAFRMDIGAEFSSQNERTIYLLEWNMGWKLKHILVAPYLLGVRN